MSFISIRQYFNKLQIAFLAVMIPPLLVFIAVYLLPVRGFTVTGSWHYVAVPLLVLLDWMLAIITFNKKIKSVRNEQGLGKKLDKYFYITIVRYCLVSSSGLILVAGFVMTSAQIFTTLYIVTLLMSMVFWPTGPRVARELMLRGDEREMVYYQKDTFDA